MTFQLLANSNISTQLFLTFMANPKKQCQKCFCQTLSCATAKNTYLYHGCWSEIIWLILWEFGRVSAIHLVIYLFSTLPRPLAFCNILQLSAACSERMWDFWHERAKWLQHEHRQWTLHLVRGSLCQLLLSCTYFSKLGINFNFMLLYLYWSERINLFLILQLYYQAKN